MYAYFCPFHEVSPHPYEAGGTVCPIGWTGIFGKGLMFSETERTMLPCEISGFSAPGFVSVWSRGDDSEICKNQVGTSHHEFQFPNIFRDFFKMTQAPGSRHCCVALLVTSFRMSLIFQRKENFNQEYVANPPQPIHPWKLTAGNLKNHPVGKTQHPNLFFLGSSRWSSVHTVLWNTAGQKRAPLGFETGELRASDWEDQQVPAWEPTYPLPRQFWRWCSFSQGGICWFAGG